MRNKRLLSQFAAFVLLFGVAACSNQQIAHFLGGLCHGADNCTAHNSDGTPVEGRWYNPH
ncbi:hypothetical protein [Pelagibius sp. 7325]|uniref:hypothetical protein n=1 Tax=Pelagibius sp. 7325 TaxID=3131994 RepID=UPI0030EEFE4B